MIYFRLVRIKELQNKNKDLKQKKKMFYKNDEKYVTHHRNFNLFKNESLNSSICCTYRHAIKTIDDGHTICENWKGCNDDQERCSVFFGNKKDVLFFFVVWIQGHQFISTAFLVRLMNYVEGGSTCANRTICLSMSHWLKILQTIVYWVSIIYVCVLWNFFLTCVNIIG